MTDPVVDMFCAQICSVGIITGSDPVYHPKGVGRGVRWENTEEAATILRKGGRKKEMKREDVRPPWCRTELISQFSCTDSKYLAFPPVLLT